MSKFQIGDDRNVGIAFIPSSLDNYGLDPFEFRIYCHIVMRARFTEDIATVAAKCRIDLKLAKKALNFLESQGLISVEETAESRSITLRDREDWKPYDRKKR